METDNLLNEEISMKKFEKVLDIAEKKIAQLPKITSDYILFLSSIGNVCFCFCLNLKKTFELYEVLANEYLTSLSALGFKQFSEIFKRLLNGLRLLFIQFISSTFEIYKKNVYLAGEIEFQKQIKFEAIENIDSTGNQKLQLYNLNQEEKQNKTIENTIRIVEEDKIINVDNDQFNYSEYIEKILQKKENIIDSARYSTCKSVITTILASMVNSQVEFNKVADDDLYDTLAEQLNEIKEKSRKNKKKQIIKKNQFGVNCRRNKVQTLDAQVQYDLSEVLNDTQLENTNQNLQELQLELYALKEENFNLKHKIRFLQEKCAKQGSDNEILKIEADQQIAKQPMKEMAYNNLQTIIGQLKSQNNQITGKLLRKGKKLQHFKEETFKTYDQLKILRQQYREALQLAKLLLVLYQQNNRESTTAKEELQIDRNSIEKDMKFYRQKYNELTEKNEELMSEQLILQNIYEKLQDKYEELQKQFDALAVVQSKKSLKNTEILKEKLKKLSSFNVSQQKQKASQLINEKKKEYNQELGPQNPENQEKQQKQDKTKKTKQQSQSVQLTNTAFLKKEIKQKENNTDQDLTITQAIQEISNDKAPSKNSKPQQVNKDKKYPKIINKTQNKSINISQKKGMFEQQKENLWEKVQEYLKKEKIDENKELYNFIVLSLQTKQICMPNFNKSSQDQLDKLQEQNFNQKKQILTLQNNINQFQKLIEETNTDHQHNQLQFQETPIIHSIQKNDEMTQTDFEKIVANGSLSSINTLVLQIEQIEQTEEIQQNDLKQQKEQTEQNKLKQIKQLKEQKEQKQQKEQKEQSQQSQQKELIESIEQIEEKEEKEQKQEKQLKDASSQTIVLMPENFRSHVANHTGKQNSIASFDFDKTQNNYFSAKNKTNASFLNSLIKSRQKINSSQEQSFSKILDSSFQNQSILQDQQKIKFVQEPIFTEHDYEKMFDNFQQNQIQNPELKKIIQQAPYEQKHDFDYFGFKRFVISLQEKHKKCGIFCSHLQKFFKKIGFIQSKQATFNAKRELMIKTKIIDKLPLIFHKYNSIDYSMNKQQGAQFKEQLFYKDQSIQ